MCLFKITNVDRNVLINDAIMIREEDFLRLGDDNYLKALASDKRGNEISKSYFYFIVNKLRQIGLLIDNALAFKVILPFYIAYDSIKLADGIIFITDDKKLVYYYYKDLKYDCRNCPVVEECVRNLKAVAREADIKVFNDLPSEAWLNIINSIKYSLLENVNYIKVKINGNIRVKSIDLLKQNL